MEKSPTILVSFPSKQKDIMFCRQKNTLKTTQQQPETPELQQKGHW